MQNTFKIRRLIALFLSIFLIISFMPIEVFGANTKHTYSKIKDLNEKYELIKDVTLREFPTTQSTLLTNFKYKEGDIVNVIAKWKNSAGNIWLQIDEGFIFEGNLKKHEHKAVMCGLSNTTYEKTSEIYHNKITNNGDDLCRCGYVVAKGKQTIISEKHRFANNSCTQCGAKNYSEPKNNAKKNYNKPVSVPETNQTVDNNSNYCEPVHICSATIFESIAPVFNMIDEYEHEVIFYSDIGKCECGTVLISAYQNFSALGYHYCPPDNDICPCGYIPLQSSENLPGCISSVEENLQFLGYVSLELLLIAKDDLISVLKLVRDWSPFYIDDTIDRGLQNIVEISNLISSGEITIEEIIKELGQSVVDGLSGDLQYLYNYYFNTGCDINKKITKEEIRELAKHTAGGINEVVNFAVIIYSAVKTVQTIKYIQTNYKSLTTYDKLKLLATQADEITNEKGHVAGTEKHTAFKRLVDNLDDSNLKTERSYLNGIEVDYGTENSIRLDVVEFRNGKITAIYDLKTSGATLTNSRIKEIRNALGKLIDDNVPIIEIKP